MFWQPEFCSRNRKVKLAITLIQLLTKRENRKKLKHIRLFSPSVLSLRFQQGLTSLGVLWEVQPCSLCACPLASVPTWEKPLRRPAPCCAGGGWTPLLSISVAYGSATSSQIRVRVCTVVLLRVLPRDISLAPAAPFLYAFSFAQKFFQWTPSPRAWIFDELVLRPPKACEGNASPKKGWLDFCFEYLLALYKQNYFISYDWSHCYSRTARVLCKCNCHKLQDELLPCGTITHSLKKALVPGVCIFSLH